MNILLPSRNVTAVLIISIALLVSVGLFTLKKTETFGQNQNRNITIVEISKEKENEDWKNTLPTSFIPEITSLSGTSSEPLTLTTGISRDLFAKFMSLETVGELNDENASELVNSLLNKYDPDMQEPLYGLTDIKISRESGAVALKKYANTFALIETTRMLVMNEVLRNNPDTDVIVDTYKKISKDLLQIEVPAQLGELHLLAINNYQSLATSFEQMIEYETDPVQAMFALREYESSETTKRVLYTELALYFANSGIIFDKNEPGYAWSAFQKQ